MYVWRLSTRSAPTSYLSKSRADSGLHGWGEATVEFSEAAVAAAVETARPQLIGQDPFDINGLVNTLHRQTYFRTGVVLRSALSGIEAALVRPQGQGARRTRLPTARRQDPRPHSLLRQCLVHRRPHARGLRRRNRGRVVDLGYTALKWDPFGSSYMDMTADELSARHGLHRGGAQGRAGIGRHHLSRAMAGSTPPPPAAPPRPWRPTSRSGSRSRPRPNPSRPSRLCAVTGPVPIATGERYFDSIELLRSGRPASRRCAATRCLPCRRPRRHARHHRHRPGQLCSGRTAQSDGSGRQCDEHASGRRTRRHHHHGNHDERRALAGRDLRRGPALC